jgi:hypothetical protein
MDPFLWNILKFQKKIEMIWWTFDNGKWFLIQKTTYPHAFLECFKHIKGLFKHGEFSWKFCSCNIESITCFLNKIIFLIYNVLMVIIFNFFLKGLSSHCLAPFFLLSTPIHIKWRLIKKTLISYCKWCSFLCQINIIYRTSSYVEHLINEI